MVSQDCGLSLSSGGGSGPNRDSLPRSFELKNANELSSLSYFGANSSLNLLVVSWGECNDAHTTLCLLYRGRMLFLMTSVYKL